MKVGVPRTWNSDANGLIMRAAQHRLDRNHSRAKNFFPAVNISKKQLKGAQPLPKAGDDLLPFGGEKNVRKKIACPGVLPPGIIANQIESHAHLAKRGGHAITARSKISRPEFRQV